MSFIVQPQTLFSIGPSRSFAGITGYVTINESTTDALEITQQPVQQGASISDHAFKKPVVLSISISFTSNFFGKSLSQIYQQLLSLQQPSLPLTPVPAAPAGSPALPQPVPQLMPFNVVTPKRTYYNMMLQTLGMTTDKKTENVLAINATFQEVIIVPIAVTNVPPSQLKNPGSNAGVQNVGNKSALKSLAEGFGLTK